MACYMGDGAVRQGAFHEALNMAMTWTLPVVFIIEIIITPWVRCLNVRVT